jgi:hypothetical protein
VIRTLWAIVAPWTWAVCWFGGRSSSSSATTTSYSTTDNRIAAAEGATVIRAGADLVTGDKLAVQGSGNVIESLSDDVVRAAFDYASRRDALAGESLDRVLTAAEQTVTRTQAQAAGQITERTMTLLIIGGGAVLAALLVRRK